MAIQVNYKHKQATPDLQRRREGETVLKKFPTKIPVGSNRSKHVHSSPLVCEFCSFVYL